MRFLYIAPRYHTNQAPIMKCLVEAGHEVCFISHYRGQIEDYTYIQPVIMGYSHLFTAWEAVYTKVLHRNNSRAIDMRLKYGFPPTKKIFKHVKQFAPDVMIIRERSIYSIVTSLTCKRLHIPAILYNQSPLWEKEIKNDLAHRLVKATLPKVRMTPVLGIKKPGYVKEDGAVFIPFVIEPKLEPDAKEWFRGNKINILCIGKYEKRKNIRMLLEIFEELHVEHNLVLTIVGECTNKFHRQYKKEQEAFVSLHHLQDKVALLENVSSDKIQALYAQTDLFVIPSTDEPASISQLEAMAFSIPVICSNQNGTACYVKDNESGYLFEDNCKEALRDMLIKMVSNQERMTEMGKQSYREILNNCSFKQYYEGIVDIMADISNNLKE